ncbi:hypothetical protein [Nitrosopumilus ureiphilus]|nr:hypothetical protein [Nitrosopumilus ureiphilus]
MTTKTTTLLLVVTIISTGLITGVMYSDEVFAVPSHDLPEQVDESRKNRVQSDIEILDISEAPRGSMPDKLTDTELIGFQQKAIQNPEVKVLLGDNYEFKNFHHVGIVDGWNVELAFYADNKENIVNVLFDHGSIIDTFKYKTVQWTHTKGMAIDHFDKSTQDVNGLQMRADIPNYSHTTGTGFTALVLNAEKDWIKSI